jgi:outer membrane receptor protein involved in Fe transport
MRLRFFGVLMTSAAAISVGTVASAQAQGAIPGSAIGADAPQSSEPALASGEIVVTAQKKAEFLSKTPVPVSTIDARSLVEQNRTRLEDYYAEVPGLSVSSGSRGEIFPSIRGLGTGSYSNPTVGFVIDGVPYGASAISFSAPNIDPDDLSRIEVLRGPQGTLYGVSSLGGLINYVTVDPSTKAFGGRIEAGTSAIRNGSGLGYTFRGNLNLPVSDTLALRVSAYTNRDAGYIDNPVRGEEGVNQANSYGGRATLLFTPSDTFSVRVSGSLQHLETDGNDLSFETPGFGYLKQDQLPGVGGFVRDVRQINATIKANLLGAELTSTTAYLYGRMQSTQDLTSVYGPFSQMFFGVPGTILTQNAPLKKFTQEVRLSGSAGPTFNWLLGGFFTNEVGDQSQGFDSVNTTTFATAGRLGNVLYRYKYKEFAAFADVTVHLTDRFQVQIGGRKSWDSQPAYVTATSGPIAGLFLGSDPSYAPTAKARSEPFTYLFTPQFTVSESMMVYARLASGFRAGGGNSPVAAALGGAASFGPDKTQNYEIGMKGSILDKLLSYDLSVYYIDWKDIQLLATNTLGQSYTANAGSAKSQGVEVSLQLHPARGTTISGWFAYNDASLSKAIPANATIFGAAGDRLPYNERYSGNASVRQAFALSDEFDGSLGGTVSYVGRRLGNFGATTTRQELPAYAKIDLNASLKHRSYTLNLYVNNLANSHGLQGGGIDIFPSYAFIYVRPRTVGMSLSKQF